MEKTNSTPSGGHDEIVMAKGSESKLYSAAEPHEKADDEVSIAYILGRHACPVLVSMQISGWLYFGEI